MKSIINAGLYTALFCLSVTNAAWAATTHSFDFKTDMSADKEWEKVLTSTVDDVVLTVTISGASVGGGSEGNNNAGKVLNVSGKFGLVVNLGASSGHFDSNPGGSPEQLFYQFSAQDLSGNDLVVNVTLDQYQYVHPADDMESTVILSGGAGSDMTITSDAANQATATPDFSLADENKLTMTRGGSGDNFRIKNITVTVAPSSSTRHSFDFKADVGAEKEWQKVLTSTVDDVVLSVTISGASVGGDSEGKSNAGKVWNTGGFGLVVNNGAFDGHFDTNPGGSPEQLFYQFSAQDLGGNDLAVNVTLDQYQYAHASNDTSSTVILTGGVADDMIITSDAANQATALPSFTLAQANLLTMTRGGVGDNFRMKSITVTVNPSEVDENPIDTVPVVTAPSNITVAATDSAGTVKAVASIAAFLTAASATDAEDGSVSVSHDAPEIFTLGDTIVIFSATDSAENTSTAQATVTVADQTAPVITLVGGGVEISVGDSFVEPGFSALDNVDGDISANVLIGETLDTSAAGTYTLSYNVTDAANNAAVQVTRTVIIIEIDTTAPVITLAGEITMSLLKGLTYTDPGYSAIDAVDGVVAVSVTGAVDTQVVDSYVLTYTATDTSGNEAQVTRTVIITESDLTAPVITLTGDNPLSLVKGTIFTDPGYSAVDGVDGVVAVSVTGAVDTNVVGSYVLTYTATDTSGNEAQAIRTVIISLTDTDGDGVPDVDDAFPEDPLETVDTDSDGIGDNADPDIDGDGVLNENDADDYVAVSQADDLDRDGVADDVDSDGVDILDAISAIEIALLAQIDSAISLDATAIDTDITPGVASFVNDVLSTANVDDVLVDSIVDGAIKRSGAYDVTVQLINTAGSMVSFDALIHITPRVSIPETVFVKANEAITFNVDLSGTPVSYPVTLNYRLETDDDAAAVIEQSTVTIDAGETILMTLPAQSRGDYQVVFSESDARNVAILDNAVTKIIAEENTPPTIAVALMSDSNQVTILDETDTDAAIAITITDVDMTSAHTLVVTLNEVEVLNTLNDVSSPTHVITLDVATLGAGSQTIVVVVTELDTEELFSTSAAIEFNIVAALPVLAETKEDGSIADSDGDGVSDAEEGFGDADGDGIADYLDDASLAANEQRIGSGDDAVTITVDDGLSISIGSTLKALESGMSDDIGIDVTPDNFITVLEIPLDAQDNLQASLADVKSFLIPLIDFKITGVRAGATVNMILPLPVALTAKAEYRKLKEDGSLIAFDISNGNAIMSAMEDAQGECPAADSDAWQTGLIEGNDCVKLAIVDGGANDDDGAANGVIVDPAVIVEVNTAPQISLDSQSSLNEGETISLNVIANDVDDDALTYLWTQTQGNTAVSYGERTDTLTFTVPSITADQVLSFTVSVSDGVTSVEKTVDISVVDMNTAPIVSASVNSTSIKGGDSVTLAARATDEQGDALSYSWVQTAGDMVTLTGADSDVATFIAPNNNTTLVFEVSVSDGYKTTMQTLTVAVEKESSSGGNFGTGILLLLAGLVGLRRKTKLS